MKGKGGNERGAGGKVRGNETGGEEKGLRHRKKDAPISDVDPTECGSRVCKARGLASVSAANELNPLKPT